MNSDFENTSPDSELDALVQQALRVEADPQQLARLQAYWSDQSQRQRRNRIITWGVFSLAVAAALSAVALFMWQRAAEQPIQLVRDTPRTESKPVPKKAAEKPERSTNESTVVQVAAPAPQRTELAGRAPTTYERAIFLTRSRTFISPQVVAAKIDSAVRELAANDNLDPQQLLATAGLRDADAETALLRKLSKVPPDERTAILPLLAVCGSRRAVSPLLHLAAEDDTRADALTTIERIVGPESLPDLIRAVRNPGERRLLLSHLLNSNSETARANYLALVRNEPTRADALAVANAAPNFPAAEFIALLDHPQEQVRVAAAMLLGHVNGPEITRRLIARVTEQPANSTEAWMALIACRGELAQEFLADATHRPQLLAHYNSARVRWVQVIQ